MRRDFELALSTNILAITSGDIVAFRPFTGAGLSSINSSNAPGETVSRRCFGLFCFSSMSPSMALGDTVVLRFDLFVSGRPSIALSETVSRLLDSWASINPSNALGETVSRRLVSFSSTNPFMALGVTVVLRFGVFVLTNPSKALGDTVVRRFLDCLERVGPFDVIDEESIIMFSITLGEIVVRRLNLGLFPTFIKASIWVGEAVVSCFLGVAFVSNSDPTIFDMAVGEMVSCSESSRKKLSIAPGEIVLRRAVVAGKSFRMVGDMVSRRERCGPVGDGSISSSKYFNTEGEIVSRRSFGLAVDLV